MPEVRIKAEPRTEFGKGPARRERRAGRVPAVLYGHGTDPRHVSLPGHDVLLALRTANVLIRLDLGKTNLPTPHRPRSPYSLSDCPSARKKVKKPFRVPSTLCH